MLMLALSGARAQPDLPPDPVIGHLQKARFGASSVVVDGQIYVLDGYGKTGRVLAGVERIDPATGGAILLTPKLRPRYFLTAESYGPYVFLFGGVDETGALTTVVERLDTRDNSVERLAPLPAGRRAASSAIVGDKIYLAGGTGDDGTDADLWIYSISDDKWSEGAPMLLAKETDLLARGDTLYAVAGFDGEAATDDFEAYDIATNHWRALAPLPFKMSAHHGAVIGDKLWTFGDFAQLGRVSSYDFASGQWNLLENTGYIARRHTTVIVADGLVWSLGGNTTPKIASIVDAMQRFDPALEAVVPWP